MDNSSADSYLHKKFKKQLSIVESRTPRHNDEKKAPAGVVGAVEDSREEEETTSAARIADEGAVVDDNNDQKRKDNNESVPNQSTNSNQNSSSSLSSSPSNLLLLSSKSSISASEDRVQSTCISFEQPKSWTVEDQSPRTSGSSSILEYGKEEAQPPPDRVAAVAAAAAGKYVCTYCNLVCSKPSVLQKHIRAHTNERPYPCNSCGFSFKTRSNLYKHCRSRTHANRVMGSKAQEAGSPPPPPAAETRSPPPAPEAAPEPKNKPYKPRFHSKQQFFNNNLTKENMVQASEHVDDRHNNSTLLSDHINDIINKNNSIVNSAAAEPYLLKRRSSEVVLADNNNEHVQRHIADILYLNSGDEPLNLTNKNRKRCMSEVVEPVAQKSLIKELLLKNLNSDMQCPHCKMIFQTVTELELHKLRSCKGFVKPGAKYSRSSSVNVASILTQNKNAFDNIPHLQNAVFPLKSPGPFLGKTRLVESDKSKSFSFDDGLPAVAAPADRYLLSPLTLQPDKEKKAPPVKLFGGEVKITHTSGETKSFKIDGKDGDGGGGGGPGGGFVEFGGGKVSENRVVKSGLQSGGTVLTNKASYPKQEQLGPDPVIRVYESTPVSPSIDISKAHVGFRQQEPAQQRTAADHHLISSSYKYTNIMDFSQNAVKLLTPNLKQPNLAVPGVPVPTKFTFPTTFDESLSTKPPEPENLTTPKVLPSFQPKIVAAAPNLCNPMKLLVNGKVVRYVPGIPGPVATDEPLDMAYGGGVARLRPQLRPSSPPPPPPPPPPTTSKMEALEVKIDQRSPSKTADKSPVKVSAEPKAIVGGETKKFARPNSLALKPTTASLKQHHGLTPTMFNQILISPDTPRVAKKYVQQFLHGNYFSYLGLKCSTKPVYCTLNKTQPFYVPHFKKLSMYSEWRQQDTKTEKLFVSGYDSRQRHGRYTTAGKAAADLVVHSSYKFVVSESSSNCEKSEEQQKSATILGGYECNDDYTYVRGRGRGRYVCDQCGIRCKKPSMLKKHIRTHSNDRPYTCSHCNFSFKTKGNLTKHMKSKAHTKNYAASGSGSSTQQSGTQSSESETEDSGMDSSDESTRREEHEAAYGLLSLSQKTSQPLRRESNSPTSSVGSSEPLNIMNSEEIAHVSKTTYAKNKILDEKTPLNFSAPKTLPTTSSAEEEAQNVSQFLGRSSVNRPLTYPYTSVLLPPPPPPTDGDGSDKREIKQFHVIQKYAPPSPNHHRTQESPSAEKERAKDGRTRLAEAPPPVKVNSVVVAPPPVLKVNDAVVLSGGGGGGGQSVITDLRKRKAFDTGDYDGATKAKAHRGDEVMDLSMAAEVRYNGSPAPDEDGPAAYHVIRKKEEAYLQQRDDGGELGYKNKVMKSNGNFIVLAPLPSGDVNINYVIQQPTEQRPLSRESRKSVEFDNSAMETLADIATKQVKLEKNTLAKSVASEFLKIATKNEFQTSGDGARDAAAAAAAYGPVTKEVNDLIVKPEGNKSCHICAKSFNKMSQLRLHLNIHYLERPFRCHSCSVSFRTKGHLQKHERSASHHNKLSSSPALSSSEPRPFKCVDCNIAFRIHGHLAKHLRSKMHIMKLECLAKIPFGLYAELERSNSLLTEINTADGDQCLESLKTLAKKVFINDPNKLNQLNSVENLDADS